MLGSTLDLGDDFVELLVLSTLLGSTLALGDDFLELFVFSAMLGSTVAPGDDFVEIVVFSAMIGSTLDTWCCQSTWSFTGAALGQGYFALIQRCITMEVPQLQFLFKVVNIPVGAQRQLPMVSFSETIEFLLLQYIDKVVDVGCASPPSSLVQSVRRQS